MSDKLEYLSAAEVGRAVNTKQLSPSEVVDYFAKRIEERNKSINAFVYTKIEEAKKEATKLEHNLVHYGNQGPFAGVPFALKDFLPSKKGWTHSHGGVQCYIKEDPCNSIFCDAMEKAGGIAIGKTNSPAFGFRGTCDNKMYGPTHNPFNLDHNSGGSSGGSAAAVADGLVPIAEGGDAGGSIRIPAAWCNCYGFKASVSTIPSVCRPDAWAATHPYCFNGGITRTVEDTAILLQFMGKFNNRDPLSRPRGYINYVEQMKRPLKHWRIGYTPDFNLFSVDKEVKNIVEKAVYRFTEAGATIEPINFKINRSPTELAETWCRSISIDTAIEFELLKRQGIDLIKDHREDFPEEFIYWNKKALESNILDYYQFNVIRTELLDTIDNVFNHYDLIISPVSTCLPVLNGSDNNTKGPAWMNASPVEQLIGFAETYLFNYTGHPAASVPAGLSSNGLPVGMQIIGPRFRDEDVLAASYTFENIQPWKDNYNLAYNRT